MDAEFGMGPVAKPNIVVEEFEIKYLPKVEGSSEMKPVEYCIWRSKGQKLFRIEDRIKDLKRDAVMWPEIEPHYEAWKQGIEMDVSGTPLEVFPALTKQQIKLFKQHDVRTMEDLVGMTDSLRNKIPMPGVMNIQEAAKRFMAARDGDKVETALAERDRTIADLQGKIEQMMEFMRAQAAAGAEPEQEEAPAKRGPGRPRKDEAA